ncbi:MAG: hypothetical protein ACI93T_002388, partial [Porticoccaceae bacterium]
MSENEESELEALPDRTRIARMLSEFQLSLPGVQRMPYQQSAIYRPDLVAQPRRDFLKQAGAL